MKKFTTSRTLYWIMGIVINVMLTTNVHSAPNYIRQDLGDAYYCDWLGNTFPAIETNGPGKDFKNKRHVNMRVDAFYVTQDGDCFTNAKWSERSGGIAVYKDGDQVLKVHSGTKGASAVTADDQFFYVADEGGIVKYQRADGKVAESIKIPFEIKGLSIADNSLFVSGSDKIQKYSLDLAYDHVQWNMPNSGNICTDSEGMLWVVENDDTPRVLRYNTDGIAQSQVISLPSTTEPAGISADADNRLWVCDISDAQQIRVYKNIITTPVVDGTYGSSIYESSVPGQRKDLRFADPIGVGVDAAGNIYVAQRGGIGTIIESRTPEGTLNWSVKGLEFLSSASIDPDNENHIYSGYSLYQFDYDKDPGQGWQDIAKLNDPFKHDYLYGSADPGNSRIGRWGKHNTPILVNLDGGGGKAELYYFEEGSHIAIPFERFTPSGKGFSVDVNGTVWVARSNKPIYAYRINGYNENGTPKYTQEEIAKPAPFDDSGNNGGVNRVVYDAEADVMYMTGYTADFPYPSELNKDPIQGLWKKGGRWLARYENWSRGNRTPSSDWGDIVNGNWGIETPWDMEADREQFLAMDIAGDYLFLVIGSKSKTMDMNRRPIVFVYQKSTGEFVGTMQPGGNIGDRAMVDMAQALTAYQRDNGEYIVLCMDDAYQKAIMYRWCPSNNCFVNNTE